VTSLVVEALLLFNFGFESQWISVQNAIDCLLPLFVVYSIRTAIAIALRPADLALSETVTVELETLALLAIAAEGRLVVSGVGGLVHDLLSPLVLLLRGLVES
jgi:hypothetical protein